MKFFYALTRLLLVSLFCASLPGTHAFSQISTSDYVTTWKTDNEVPENTQITIPAYGEYTVYYESIPAGISGTLPETGTFTDNQTITFPAAGTYRVAIKPTGSIPFHRIAFGDLAVINYTLLTVEQWGTTVWSSMELAYENCWALTTLPENDAPVLTSVTAMQSAFSSCFSLTGSSKMNDWDVSNVTNMQGTFSGTSLFNQSISNWNVSNVTNMQGMFMGALAFNQPLENWDVGNVTTMRAMFWRAATFNQPIGNWNVGIVTDMREMFLRTYRFNQPLENWDVGNVSSMSSMFERTESFNQPLGNWNVANVTDMQKMFLRSEAFNQPLDRWLFNPNVNLSNIFEFSKINCANYNTSLIGWAANPNMPDGLSLGVAGLVYGLPAETAHDYLITTKGWIFEGDSYDGTCTSLPVTLVSFEVKKQESSLLLTWSTTEETNSDRFEIQRSADAKNWNAIGQVESSGESMAKQTYVFSDIRPLVGRNYYRLRMVDKDDTFAYSRTLTVEFHAAPALSVYPNPASEKLSIHNYEQVNYIEVFNAAGAKLLESKNVTAQGIDISHLSAGLHMVKMVLLDGSSQQAKLVITR